MTVAVVVAAVDVEQAGSVAQTVEPEPVGLLGAFDDVIEKCAEGSATQLGRGIRYDLHDPPELKLGCHGPTNSVQRLQGTGFFGKRALRASARRNVVRDLCRADHIAQAVAYW